MKKRWKARSEEGSIRILDLNGFKDYVSTLGKELAVTVEPWKRTTTNPQFAYYYGVIVEIFSGYTGFSKEEMDIILRNKFLSEFIEFKGQIIRKTYSKTTVSTARFNQFCEDCKRWAAEEFDLYIPDPNEVDATQFQL